MRRTTYMTSLLLFGGLFAVPHFERQTQTTTDQRNELKQLTAKFQQAPGDQALREKIIALALSIDPKPATPDGAIMAEGAAEYAFKNAKTNADYSDAAKQYEKALLLAPWLATDYFNCGVAYEKAGENKEAIRSFTLYLLAAPNADDAQAVKKRIGGLQYAVQKAQDAASDQAGAAARKVAAERQQAQVLQDTFAPLNGGVWKSNVDRWGNYSHGVRISNNAFTYFTIINNAEVIRRGTTNAKFDNDLGYYWKRCDALDLTLEIHDREFTIKNCDETVRATYTISRDYQTITEHHADTDPALSFDYVFKRLK